MLGREKDYKLLFEYLRQIIYLPEKAYLDKTQLSSDAVQLAQGLDVLHTFVLEATHLGYDLANGKTDSARMPSRENVLAGPLKAVHGTLQHLTWMMDEIAAGDYKQRLELLNDLSKSFNSMVAYLVELSYQDKLTGLLNVEGFDKHAKDLLRAHTAPDYYMVSINVNDFRHYNVLYGSERGDALLVNVSNHLQFCCGKDELCGRLTADHFMCLVRGSSAEDVVSRLDVDKAQQWQGITSRTYLFRHGVYKITDYNMNIRTMRECATYAANSIPKSSRFNYGIFDKQLQSKFVMENSILNSFEEALREEAFKVYVQPKVDLKTNVVTSCEALVRWQSPDKEILLPGEFINLFETNGLITALDFYMAEQVCKWLRNRLDKGLKIIPVAVNFSRMHLLDNDFIRHLVQILNRYQIEPKWFEVELTESAFFENEEAVIKMMQALHQAGFTIAMDDFGSGFSSLNFLKNIPIDVLKIDKLFFDNFMTDIRGRLVLEDILSIAKHLRLKTVAEGVEAPEEVEFLRHHGCDFVQGYYFYKPLALDKMDELFQQPGKVAVL
jgi:EAL domain-containing protein (putative c-di-GMP-specific phosphodiesterase class I)/GGDEF domain-containing protein